MTSRDQTFRSFTPEQAAQYASGRGGAYPTPIYQTIMDYHQGKRSLCLDVGTGPGKAVWDLLAYFERCIGCDTSAQMIEQAKKDAAERGVGDKTSFVVCGGEDCVDALSETERGTVDLVTCAMAAHWMDLPAFYVAVSKALRPGGTLAVWTCSSYYCHPSVPNYKAIQAVLEDLEDNILGPYMTPGNRMSRSGYDTLTLPWSIPGMKGMFVESAFQRADWDRYGIPSSPSLPDGSPGPFLCGERVTRQKAEAGLSSSSAVIRWREANPEKAHTDEDAIKIIGRRLQEIMGENDRLIVGPSCTLLMMRKA